MTIAIINRKSGTSLGYSPEELEELLQRAFSGAGLDVTFEFVEPEEIADALKRVASQEEEMFIVGGGDGTVNTAARHAIEHDKTLGILPMGTLNRLAHDLDLPLDLPEAARLIAQGTARRIDAAEVNGEIFFCNSLFGLPALFAEARAKLRERPLWDRLRGYLIEFPRAALSARRLAVKIENGSEAKAIRGLAFGVSNNPYEEEQPFTLRRGLLNKGLLGFYATKHYSAPAVLLLLLRIMIGQWNGDPYFVRMKVKKVEVHSSRSFIKLTNDGEVMEMATPLTFRSRPQALSVITPSPT